MLPRGNPGFFICLPVKPSVHFNSALTKELFMTGFEALAALKAGKRIRMRRWTPGNFIVAIWSADLEHHIVCANGSYTFHSIDCKRGDALWILECMIEDGDIWELHVPVMKSQAENVLECPA